ncbi:MAG: hypothetical protein JST22_08080 [Bacteroidetes bacterium]|nr:hypothetical protein [Bacteroidota bacterium]
MNTVLRSPKPLLLLLLSFAVVSALHAQISYPDFNNTAGLRMVGKAAVGPSNSLRISPSTANAVGAVWYDERQLVGAGFVATFAFKISNPGGQTDGIANGGDGFAFVVQNESDSAIGYSGGSLGYEGITKSIAIEFDTWNDGFARNGDPNGNHVSINTRGVFPNSSDHGYSITSTIGVPNMTDGAVHNVVIQYYNKVMSIYMDNCSQPILEAAVDLNALLKLDSSKAWLGFTAASLSAWENHDILNWRTASVGLNVPDTVNMCNGDSVELRVQSLTASCTWNTGARTPAIVAKTSGVYTVNVLENLGCRQILYSRTVHVQTVDLPEPDVQASGPLDLCKGDIITLDAGVDAYAYLWSTGARTRKIDVNDSGTYYVDVIAPGCSKRSQPVQVRVHPVPAPVITPVGRIALCRGDSVTLQAPSGYKSYRWSNGDTNVVIRVGDSTNYTVQVTDSAGCTGTSPPLLVRVVRQPSPTIVLHGHALLCPGDTVVLEAPAGYDRYLWTDGSTGQAFIARSAGTYTVTVSTAEGCSGTAQPVTIALEAPPSPTITVEGSSSLCPGDSVRLQAPPGFKVYRWSNGDTTSSTLVRAAGNYSVTVTDTIGCTGTSPVVEITISNTLTPVITPSGPTTLCQGDSVTLEAPPGFASYAWSSGESTPEVVVHGSGSYNVTVRSTGGCTGTSAPVDVTVHPLPAAPTIVESNGTLTTVSASAYQWYRNGAAIPGATNRTLPVQADGSYEVVITDANGCGARSAPYTINTTGVSTRVAIAAATGSVGDRVEIPIVLDASNGLDDSRARSFTATLHFDASMLLPAADMPPGTVTQGMRVITINGNRPAGLVTGELARLAFTAMLGDSAATEVVLDHFAWLDGSWDVETANGRFTLTGYCTNGGERLLEVTAGAGLKSVRPNPATDELTIGYELTERGRTQLMLADEAGRIIRTLEDRETMPGTYEARCDLRTLPTGTYTCLLETPTQRFTAGVVVVH